MTSITSISAASAAAAYRVEPAPPARRDLAPPTPDPGTRSGVPDPDRLDRVSSLLDLPVAEVAAQSPAELVTMLQNRGLDVGELRNVMSSGDLLDVRV
ncbi:hypothetical protein AB0M54_41255 [Actinoplanes sp. NPDC051470]|uniref:hypothetical protein n=1 Tax=unclassified Actinoplanes TaxID=2626549 RepID=UPI00343C9819